jgi:hypothetical protein
MKNLTPVDLARAAVTAQSNLLADRQKSATAAIEARSVAEKAVTDCQSRLEAARAASAADRDSVELANALSVASAQLGHAQLDLTKAVDAYTKSQSDLREAESNLAGAQRSIERVEIETALTSGRYESEASDDVRSVASALLNARAALSRIRERQAQDRVLVQRARELGSAVEPRDGTFETGVFYDALELASATLPGTNVHALRWLLDFTPVTSRPADPHANRAMKAVADFVYDSIITAEKTEFGKGPVHDAAMVWPLCRNKGEAERRQTTDAKTRADARAAEVAAAHAARLEAARRPKPRSVIGEVAGKLIERIIEGPAAEPPPSLVDDGPPLVPGEFRVGEQPRPRVTPLRPRPSTNRPNPIAGDLLDTIDGIERKYAGTVG